MAGTYLLLRDETCALERIGFFSIWLKYQVLTPNGSEASVCAGVLCVQRTDRCGTVYMGCMYGQLALNVYGELRAVL